MVVVEDVLVETFWKCSHCGNQIEGATSSEGESLICPECGAAKKEEKYLIQGDPSKDKVLPEGIVPEGRNWSCDFCQADNREGRLVCEVCGAKRKSRPSFPQQATSDTPRQSESQPEVPVISPVSPEDFQARKSPPSTPLPAVKVTNVDRPHWVEWTAGILLTLTVLAGIVLGLMWLFEPHKTFGVVESIQWQRTETMVELRRHPGSGWRDNNGDGKDVVRWGACENRQDGMENCRPFRCNPHMEDDPTQCTGGGVGQYNCRSVPESYNCRDVPDRSRCRVTYINNGNGTARRQTACETKSECQTRNVPRCDTRRIPRMCRQRQVYGTCYNRCPHMRVWCNFTYQSWDIMTTQMVSGRDHSPRWFGLTPMGPHQRVNRTESFQVLFRDTRDQSKTWITHPTAHDYESYSVGQRWELTWARVGEVMPLRLLPN